MRAHHSAICCQPNRSTRRGVATVELALLLPMLVFLFLVTLDFARIFHFSIIVTSCARNGALYATDQWLHDRAPYESVEQAVLADAGALKPLPAVSVAEDKDDWGNTYVEVTVDYPFSTVSNFPGIPETVNLRRTARMLKYVNIAEEEDVP